MLLISLTHLMLLFLSLDYCSQCFLCYFGSYILIYYYFLHTLVQWFSTREIPLTIREAWQSGGKFGCHNYGRRVWGEY